ncbi:MAG: SLBB domain-containing protein, partial [Cyclobacteriaceae bacterium]
MIGRDYRRLLRLIFFFFVLSAGNALAQEPDIDIETIKNINVDDLSDEQIQKFIDEMDKRGISIGQMEVLAQARGVSSIQIQKLRNRIMEVRSGSQNTSGASELNRIRSDQAETTEDKLEEDDQFFDVLLEGEEEEIVPEEQVFGMNLFQSENLTFQPSTNIPTPKSYQLGAGDNIIIDIWGASERVYQLTVSPEGSIRIPNVGPIYVSGMEIGDATTKIKSRLKRIYSNLGYNTYADISLGQLRTISVNIVGEVENQGSYTMSSFATVFNALYYAGGPNENGSLRKIDHYRDGKKIATVDIYDYLFNGIGGRSNLNDQDLIIVRPFAKRVQVKGEVKRQGYYEVTDSETLEQLLAYSGGFTSNAFRKSVTVRRNRDLRKAVETVSQDEFATFKLQAGDEVLVSPIMDRFENRVQISGAVNRSGEYEYSEGMTLKELILTAEGLREDAFMKRGTIIRLNDDLTLSSIPFDINQVMLGEEILLKNEDYVEIKSIFDLRDEYIVQIQGEVRDPGEYA